MGNYLHMAHGYHLDNGRIIPNEGEPISKLYDDNDLLFDFILLLRECVRRPRLYDAYFGVHTRKDDDNKIKNYIREYRKERNEIADCILAFVNIWGLFGLIHDEAVFDYYKDEPEGGKSLLGSPAYAIQTVSQLGDIEMYNRMDYNVYSKRFFPTIEGRMPFLPNNKRFITHYSEHIDDILQNPRFISCVDYIRSIDKQKKRTFTIKNVDINLTIQNEPIKDRVGNILLVPKDSRIKEVPLVKLCQILLYNNEMQPKSEKEIRICSYRRCHMPYRKSEREGKKYSMYCKEKCRRNANKGRNR